MLFLLSLLTAVIFTLLCGDVLKKHPIPFYVGSAVISVLLSVFPFKNTDGIVKDYALGAFQKGALPAAFFVLVMFAGAFRAGSKEAKKLMPIRAELAIIASILTVTHLVIYGLKYLTRLFSSKLHGTQTALTVFALIMTVLLIPLAVTSFKKIRKSMNAKKWKALQRSAYAFYALLYLHILLAYLPAAWSGKAKSMIDVAVYSAVFISYAAMRISKALVKKYKENEKTINISSASVGAAALAAITLLIAVPNISAATAKENVPVPASSDVSSAASSEQSVSSKQSTASAASYAVSSAVSSEKTTSVSSQKSPAVSSSKVISSRKTDAVSSGKTSSISSGAATQEVNEEPVQDTFEDDKKHEASPASTAHGSDPSEKKQENDTENDTASQADEVVSDFSEEMPNEPERIYNDGVYSAECYEEDDDVRVKLTVTVTIENDRIVDIEALSDETDPWYIDRVKKDVIPVILGREREELDSLEDIDTVSGATLSSRGVMRAVADALREARVS